MTEKKVSGIAVVNSEGKLTGNISVSDFKLAHYENSFWDLLNLPVKEYLLRLTDKSVTKIRPHVFAMVQEKGNDPVVVSVKLEDTLITVVKFITFYSVHRLFVTDATGKPIGVISLHDILQLLLSK